MKRSINLFAVISILAFSAATFAQTGNEKRVLTSADYARAEKMLSFTTAPLVTHSSARPTFLPDGKFWYSVMTANGMQFVLVDPANGSKRTGTTLAELGVTMTAASAARGRRDPSSVPQSVSPDGKKAVYIKDWNLWVRDVATNKETQLTTDGIENFGYATDNAGWTHSDRPVVLWSDDSKKIATFQQDQRHVSDMYLVSTNVGAPKLEQWKYPLPQDKEIAKIHRVVIDIDSGKLTRFKMEPDDHRSTLCDDISCSGGFDDNEFNADASKLAFVSSSRDHKSAKLRIADTATGDVRDVFVETVPTQYESGQGAVNWRYLPKTNEFIWYSERSNWGHLYLYDLTTGKLKNPITTGDFVVTQLVRVDEANRVLYFNANGREKGSDPYFSHFYSVNMDGSNLTLLTPENANHQVSLSPDGKYFVDNFSTPNVAPTAVLRDAKGKMIAELEKADISKLTATGWKPPTPITVKSRDGKWDLYGLMFTPTNLDPKVKYPIVNYIYPGPQAGGVGSRSFSPSRGDHQALAELGFVVVIIDGSCNPSRSKAFHDACYGNMADNTLEDQISGLKQLAEKYPYLDLDRVGMWGHSGGGFATAAAMFRYPDFYKVGISESGNHDNRNYEDDWGERYIGLMVGPDGKHTTNVDDSKEKSNYTDQANQNFAKNLKGKLLLAHGGMDDNVPPYNTYLVVDALIKANKDFDLIIFPNARHGYGADSLYMMRRRWDYFVTNLMGAEAPKNYEISPPQRMMQR